MAEDDVGKGTGIPKPEDPVLGVPVGSEEPSRGEQAFDPLIDGSGLSKDQKQYLTVLAEVGMPYRAIRAARQRFGVTMTQGTLMLWRRDNREFQDLYETIRREYWDEEAAKNVALARTGKVHGGAANLLMQQLNRALPEEYLPAIQQQIHQTISYEVEGAFRDKPEPKPEDAVVLVPLAKGTQ